MVELLLRFASITADGVILDAILKSNLPRFNDWPLNFTVPIRQRSSTRVPRNPIVPQNM